MMQNNKIKIGDLVRVKDVLGIGIINSVCLDYDIEKISCEVVFYDGMAVKEILKDVDSEIITLFGDENIISKRRKFFNLIEHVNKCLYPNLLEEFFRKCCEMEVFNFENMPE